VVIERVLASGQDAGKLVNRRLMIQVHEYAP
jgi:hypothetical protein